MGKLTGKVAIVAGAGRGIGRATAELFAREGAKVVVLSLTPANVNAVVSHIQSIGGTALGIVCDLGDGQQITRAVAEAAEVFGGIDILVNVAFDPTVVHSPILELTVEQLQRNLDMGPIAYLRTMQACYPYLKASGEGRIINFASLAGSGHSFPRKQRFEVHYRLEPDPRRRSDYRQRPLTPPGSAGQTGRHLAPLPLLPVLIWTSRAEIKAMRHRTAGLRSVCAPPFAGNGRETCLHCG